MAQQTASTTSTLSKLEVFAAYVNDWLIDLVFPPRCGHCGRVDYRFCANCRCQLDSLPLQSATSRPDSLDEVRATGAQRGILESAVKSFKYHDATELSEPLAARMVACLYQQKWQIDAIVPVPLHTGREFERGYNQSNLLSLQVTQATGIPCESAWLRRIRGTTQQAQLAASERRQNVAGAFQASADVAGQSILLVDDVITTGSTLSACAEALRERKAKMVYGIALSHAL